MAKTFAKITKMFIRLSVTIVAIKRRPILILQLEVKYPKMKSIRKKLSKEYLDYKKSTLDKSTVKPASKSQQSKSTSEAMKSAR